MAQSIQVFGDIEAYAGYNWAGDALTPQRSEMGRRGVHFVAFPDTLIVAKMGRTTAHEYFSTQLARAAGLHVPSRLALYLHSAAPPAMRDHLALPDRNHILLMDFVEGTTFRNLSQHTSDALRHLSPRGRSLLRQAGHVYAFDYFIANDDRFPTPSRRSCNPGNLMVAGDRVVAIDSCVSLSDLIDGGPFFDRYRERRGKVLDFLNALDSAPGRAAIAEVGRFFRDVLPEAEGWSAMREDFIAGIVAGLKSVATLDARDLEAVARACGGRQVLGGPTLAFLHRNLADISAAVRPNAPAGGERGHEDWRSARTERATARSVSCA